MNQKLYNTISTAELSGWLEKGTEIILMDVLLNEHFRRVHLPNAVNACVHEVTFPGQVRNVTAEKTSKIVLYGSSARSLDSVAAAEKLAMDGYRDLYVLKGGIEAWRYAGLPLEGDATDSPDDPKTRFQMNLENRRYQIDTDLSTIHWIGRNPRTTHLGTIRLSGGELIIKKGDITGEFHLDMKSIDNLDLEGNELKPVLLAHLSSYDFFLTKKFPRAEYRIGQARQVAEPFLCAPNYKINGELSLRGIRKPLDFMATVTKNGEKGLTAEAHFDIDRTQWGVLYGSARFFEHLGMHLVFDAISLQINVVAV